MVSLVIILALGLLQVIRVDTVGYVLVFVLSVNTVLMKRMFIKFFSVVDNAVLRLNYTTFSEC
jgi:hypothetical protein